MTSDATNPQSKAEPAAADPKPESPLPEATQSAEAPKAEAPKAEAPKAEAPKAEAPKAEAPKAEAPKAEAPKAEAPKAEAPKAAAAPKPEAPKAAAAKPAAGGGGGAAAGSKKSVKPRQPLGGTKLREVVIRVALGLAGTGLFAGFFMPWLRQGLDGSLTMTGFSLMASDGEVFTALSGAARMLLLAVPMLGVALMVGGMTGHRSSLWVALIAGAVIVAYGLVVLVRLFLQTTGTGLWLVVGCALLALVVGLWGMGRRSKT